MERSVERRHHGDIGLHCRSRRPDSPQGWSVVKGRQVAERLDSRYHLVVDGSRLDEAFAAVDDPVTDSLDPVGTEEPDAIQPLKKATGGLSVIAHLDVRLQRLAALRAERDGRPAAHAVYDAVSQPSLAAVGCDCVPNFDYLELQRRAAAVDNEDLHRAGASGSAWSRI